MSAYSARTPTRVPLTMNFGVPETRVRVLAAVIQCGDKYLVCQRPVHKRHGGLWEFPGGKLELGESLLVTAIRELAQELDVHVTRAGEVLFSAQDRFGVRHT